MTTNPKDACGRGSRRFWADRRGVTLALVALTVPVLLAITGLGVDAGWWYTVRRQNQSGADAGAISAAYEILAGKADPATNLVPAANGAATQNGYAGDALGVLAPPCTPTASSTVCYVYTDTLVPSGVQVVLNQQQNTWFASLASLANVTIANRAVAAVETLDNACIILLNPTADKELNIQGSASLTMPTCSVCADSTASDAVYAQGANNSILTADTIITAGEVATTGQPKLTLNKPAQIGAPGCPDPYASTLTHSFLAPPAGLPTCPATVSGSLTTYGNGAPCQISGVTVSAALKNGNVKLAGSTEITGGVTVKGSTGSGTLNLGAPGTYWVTDGNLSLGAGGTLECTACVAGGAGVTIILTTAQASGGTVGNVTMQGNPTIDSLNAPASGAFDSLLLIQDSNGLPPGTTFIPNNGPGCTGSCSTFEGNPGQTLNGLVYFPDNPLTFQGNPTTGSTACLLVVANTMSLAGNSSMSDTGCNGAGKPPEVKTVALVE